MPGGILFHGRSRDCLIQIGEAALILSELHRVTFDGADAAAAAAHAISDGFATGEVGPLPEDQAAALQAVLLQITTQHPAQESVATLHDALTLDYGEL